jgi:hypothetical protein
MIDSALGDIHPQDVLPRGHSLKPRTHITIQQFTSDDESMLATGFRVTELMTIKNFFRMDEAQDIVGFIRIHNYCFTSEEILLFVLWKLKSGNTNAQLCDAYFGGDERKWSFAMQWFINSIYSLVSRGTETPGSFQRSKGFLYYLT